MTGRTTLFPCLRYKDAPAAIKFLCDGFGFAEKAVYAHAEDPSTIVHAELTLGDCMLMLGTERPTPLADLYRWRSVDEAGGVTGSLCVHVEEVDAHCARARAAGAEILAGPYDNQGYPGRSYDARDPGGHAWNFTSYDPWA